MLCDNLKGQDGMGGGVGRRLRREGTYVYLWLIHVAVCKKPRQYCKVIILQIKKKKENNVPKYTRETYSGSVL